MAIAVVAERFCKDCVIQLTRQEAYDKINGVEQQARPKEVRFVREREVSSRGPVSVLEAELRSAEASRRLGALDLRMSGVQGGLGEHKRDILKLREAGIPCS